MPFFQLEDSRETLLSFMSLYPPYLRYNFLINFFYKHLFFKFIYLFWERQRKHEQGGTEREGERESQADSAWSVFKPWTHETLRAWPELKSRIRHLTNWVTQEPLPLQTFRTTSDCVIIFPSTIKYNLENSRRSRRKVYHIYAYVYSIFLFPSWYSKIPSFITTVLFQKCPLAILLGKNY